jgi:predicted amidophosphoribosyltransferase
MRAVVRRAVTDCASAPPTGAVELATIPSTRAAFRQRGYHPIELVLARAGLRASHPLRLARQTTDQATLGLTERLLNRDGSLVARADLSGRSFLLVDDIVTTGSTLREARRAIESAGGIVHGAAVLANTERTGRSGWARNKDSLGTYWGWRIGW